MTSPGVDTTWPTPPARCRRARYRDRQRVGRPAPTIGAQESRFNFSADSISTQTQNLQSANSAIKDVDIAAEQATLSSAEVKTQAAVSAETAANQMPQYLLKLLG